jgi:S-adenosylmethionine:diacylglycerol 3-amino-3-carboxypropyl transferase
MNKPPIYDFGLCQEDVQSELKGLDVHDGDRLLCIASGGEIPLNMAALRTIEITAVDISLPQIYLSELKRVAATRLEPFEAAGFLGYFDMPEKQREALFQHAVAPGLNTEELFFWKSHLSEIRSGVIHAGRFERFIQIASRPALWVIGKRNLMKLFTCTNREEREALFDKKIAKPLLKIVFHTVFHPAIYKNKGIREAGLQHRKGATMGQFFFQRFRDFCCSTPARENFLLHYIFFRRALFAEALPAYLQPANREKWLENAGKIRFICVPIGRFLEGSIRGSFNKIQLSNVSDWLSKEEMEQHLTLIMDKTLPGSRITLRYIHYKPEIPDAATPLVADEPLGHELDKSDSFPFFSILPVIHSNP